MSLCEDIMTVFITMHHVHRYKHIPDHVKCIVANHPGFCRIVPENIHKYAAKKEVRKTKNSSSNAPSTSQQMALGMVSQGISLVSRVRPQLREDSHGRIS